MSSRGLSSFAVFFLGINFLPESFVTFSSFFGDESSFCFFGLVLLFVLIVRERGDVLLFLTSRSTSSSSWTLSCFLFLSFVGESPAPSFIFKEVAVLCPFIFFSFFGLLSDLTLGLMVNASSSSEVELLLLSFLMTSEETEGDEVLEAKDGVTGASSETLTLNV